eukprot:gb/GECH01009651.1/.p1 GENE.gb/GECH01009651.1/~~gb/GECH01009651.1/.p1  ORF type:complete len:164 (+),score=3.49 gb/GECH01009651.1/:1-492(+)
MPLAVSCGKNDTIEVKVVSWTNSTMYCVRGLTTMEGDCQSEEEFLPADKTVSIPSALFEDNYGSVYIHFYRFSFHFKSSKIIRIPRWIDIDTFDAFRLTGEVEVAVRQNPVDLFIDGEKILPFDPTYVEWGESMWSTVFHYSISVPSNWTYPNTASISISPCD